MAFSTREESRAYAKGRADERRVATMSMQYVGASAGGPVAATGQPATRKSDQRFRSFAERYVIARADKFRVGHEAEDGWHALMDAKRLYTMIRQGGENLSPEDGGQ